MRIVGFLAEDDAIFARLPGFLAEINEAFARMLGFPVGASTFVFDPLRQLGRGLAFWNKFRRHISILFQEFNVCWTKVDLGSSFEPRLISGARLGWLAHPPQIQ